MIAVLDWELSTTGQPLADFAYFLMHHYWPVDMDVGSMGSLKGIEGKDLIGIPEEHKKAIVLLVSSLMSSNPTCAQASHQPAT